MRALFRRRKQKSTIEVPPSQKEQQQEPPTVNTAPQLVERKIHPDLNALADELDPLPQTHTENTPPISFAAEYHERRSSSIELQPLSVPRKKRRRASMHQEASTPPADDTASGIFSEWPTFGRKASQATMADVVESSTAYLTPKKIWRRKRSHSWGSRSQSTRPAQSPDSSLYPYMQDTPPSRSHSSQYIPGTHIVPSPDIFGLRRRSSSKSTRASSYFPKVETPPPLPPLDHPAFRQSSGTFGRASHTAQHEDERHVNVLRVSHSLPALSTTRSAGRRNSAPVRRREARRRSTASSNVSRKSKQSHGKSLSRRSSAELSSKRASSTGQSGEEKGWEVPVTKEILRMSAFSSSNMKRAAERRGPESRKLSQYGNMGADARGDNQQSFGGVKALGSPFFLQDTHTDYLPDTLFTRTSTSTNTNDKYPSSSSASSSAIAHRINRLFDMSQGDETARNSQRRDKGKGKEAPSASPSTPRRKESTSSRHNTPNRTRTPPPPHLRPIPDFGPILQSSSSNPTLQVTAPTPVTPTQKNKRTHLKSSPAEPQSSVLRQASPPPVQKSHSSGSAGGKRKAEEVEGGTPPKDTQKEQRATFAIEPRPHRQSAGTSSSLAPSSFHRQKRARLSATPESRPPSRSSTAPTQPQGDSPNSKNGTFSKASRAASQHGSYAPSTSSHQPHRAPSRRSLSQASIPFSALLSPHAPSIVSSGRFHMRDPRKPTIQRTPWSLSFPEYVDRGKSRWSTKGWVERGGSPLHAWLFFLGFVLFPLWWAAAVVVSIPMTRRLGENDAEKGVVLDDPQVEFDAKSWRTRCRVMAVVSFFTYIPFIILVAIFASK